MTYIERELICRRLVLAFVNGAVDANAFVKNYMDQWRADRDEEWARARSVESMSFEERTVCEMLDRAFTACDCYEPTPVKDFEISAEQLRMEMIELFKLGTEA